MARLLVLNGPNLNLLGTREPDLYGSTTLADINLSLTTQAQAQGHHLLCLQSNAEHELIEGIHRARQERVDFIIINPAAFTHTSIALRDALAAVNIPFIEVHLSNIHQREHFRRQSYFSDLAVGLICGLGAQGYSLALQAACDQLNRQDAHEASSQQQSQQPSPQKQTETK
ncbi:MAG: type II 3-dehydroquinate dehydratase [Cellvibrionaceae bacterium]|nr:type II 3-dehydroquinate dehydratase [Cellvibrionaceae bacterium]